MAFCSKCGAQYEDGAEFCPACGRPVGAPPVSAKKTDSGSGPLFWRIYTKAFGALMEKPIRLWGISLLGTLLICIGSMLAGVAIPAIAICIEMLFTVALAAIFLKGYHRQQVYCRELFDTFKDWATIKRVLTGMGWSALWIFLWALIPIVGPIFAIIKGYEHALVPYILVKKPELNAIEARDLSREKTKGFKLQMFLADLVVYALIFIAMLILGLLCRIPYAKYLFFIVLFAFTVCVIALLPLFRGIVHAAFYEEIIGDDDVCDDE